MTTPTIKNPEAPASEKQIAFLIGLSASHEVGFSPEDAAKQVHALASTGKFTMKMASDMIERWKAAPKRAVKRAEPGYYYLPDPDEAVEGRFIVVVENKAKTGTYAKVLSNDVGHWRWEYQKGLAYEVADLKPITIEQATEFGKLHGRCLRCLRPLTDPTSVLKSLGPTCAKYFTA